MAKAEASVEELVSMIERGELRLPEMQRQYVWRSTRVRDLLDSLYRGYPSGAILLWETDEAVPLQDFAVSQSTNPYQSTRLLLDGQQRLTSLSAVIRGEPVSVRGRRRPIDLLFNLEHPDQLAVVTEVEENGDDEDDADDDSELIGDETDSTEDELLKRFNKMTFVVATRKLEQLPHWVKVSEVFKTDNDAPFLKRAGISGFDDPRYEKYSQRLARLRGIRKYVYRMDVLERTLSYDEVTEIFVRVNSLGAKLRSSDLALAQITAKWRHSLQTFQDFQKVCAKTGFDLDLGLHLKNLMAFATGQSRFQIVGSLNVEKLQKAWKEACDGMEFALNFLRSNLGIDSPALLSSPFLLVVLAYFGHSRNYALSNDEARQLRYWALMANAKGRFSRGSSETILDQDLANIRQGGAVSELIDRLRLQFGRLDITAEELEGRNQRSALFKTMFLAFRAAGAKDWRSHLTIALDHSGAQHRLQFHHIFPKAVLKTSFTAREADDIANLAFIGGKTNRAISDKAPAVYLPPLVDQLGEPAFAAQCIPVEASLLEVESYKAFLLERRKRIATALNTFAGPAD
ncbi:GmrSD restriction endonuclease domain-containing protein [Achromobacter xylosoxidans]